MSRKNVMMKWRREDELASFSVDAKGLAISEG